MQGMFSLTINLYASAENGHIYTSYMTFFYQTPLIS